MTVSGWQKDEDYADWIARGCPVPTRRIPLRIATADVQVTITSPVRKLCPVKNEVDEGTATITYRTHGQAIELHNLALYLGSFSGIHMSHEDFTKEVAEYTGAHVSTTWSTAGMEVRCEVFREPNIVTESA